MHILFLNPFHGGSHAAVAEGYARNSRHRVTLLALSPAGGWRWRMRGAALTFARMLPQALGEHGRPDVILTTDMLDLATFLGLTRGLTAGIPVALYFHENQLTYPLPAGRPRDLAFPWVNYTAALAADRLLFNSAFHQRAFLEALPDLPGRYHDHRELDLIDQVAAKSLVLPPGIDLAQLDPPPDLIRATGGAPTLLWNSRWEYDKQPQVFFEALAGLAARGIDFRVIVGGEPIDPDAPEFRVARDWLGPHVLAWGYTSDPDEYRRRLWQADLVVSTAIQEFFGVALIEAMYCRCVPIVPRRLSYPELLPEPAFAPCFYADDAQLTETLAQALAHLPRLHALNPRTVAARYDWSQMAPRYDAALANLARL